MAFQNFAFPQVVEELGLTLSDADLFADVKPVPVQPDFLAQLTEGANLASAINTEKARSEFVIAPVLLELRRLHLGRIGLFSEVMNQAASTPVPTVYGAVTTGTAWKFLQLQGTALTLGLAEHHVESVGKILGILGHIVDCG
jgi:hypothetical protein